MPSVEDLLAHFPLILPIPTPDAVPGLITPKDLYREENLLRNPHCGQNPEVVAVDQCYTSVDPSVTENFCLSSAPSHRRKSTSLEAAELLLSLARKAAKGEYQSPEGRSPYQLLIGLTSSRNSQMKLALMSTKPCKAIFLMYAKLEEEYGLATADTVKLL
ncbi:hypothetical protein F5880DRAFT_1632420 [Lentinula raphanica]|nr:hypothetical protein F5880DRAFT_1632420 [Lentinula raphanica]